MMYYTVVAPHTLVASSPEGSVKCTISTSLFVESKNVCEAASPNRSRKRSVRFPGGKQDGVETV